MERSCFPPRQTTSTLIITERLPGLSVAESAQTSSVVSICLAPTEKVEKGPRYQQASFLVGSLLTFPTASRAFLCLPKSPSAHSFPSAATNGLNSTELSSCFSLLTCIFQPNWHSSFYGRSLHFRSPNVPLLPFHRWQCFLGKPWLLLVSICTVPGFAKPENLRNVLSL